MPFDDHSSKQCIKRNKTSSTSKIASKLEEDSKYDPKDLNSEFEMDSCNKALSASSTHVEAIRSDPQSESHMKSEPRCSPPASESSIDLALAHPLESVEEKLISGDQDKSQPVLLGAVVPVNELDIASLLTPERTHRCPVCAKEVRSKVEFVRHYMTHTGERPFCCSHCSYKSTRKFTLIRHIKAVHNCSD